LARESDPRLLAEAVALGGIGGLAAVAFMWVLHYAERLFLVDLAGYAPPGLPSDGGVLRQHIGSHGLWLIPLATTVGGLISGILVYTFAPEAEGHGTDTAVKAFHRTGGYIRARVAPLKLLASAITIGSGGSAGREGPIALIGAGCGSIYATLGRRKDEDRRLLVLMGMAAGLSAIFRSPVGSAFFAVEVLYGSMAFESGALLYTMLAAVVAYGVQGLFVGWRPLFQFSAAHTFISGYSYGWFIVLGVMGGVIATILPMVFYGLRDLFRALPTPPAVNPAIGGLIVGLIALGFPQVLGGGYGWIQEAINGQLALHLLFILLFLKMAAFCSTVSSGGSGGVFAPTLFIGAMLGGGIAALAHVSAEVFTIVGMLTVFGAAARVPIAALVMVTEMTGGYHLLPAASFSVVVGYIVQKRLSRYVRYRSLYEAQVGTPADSPARYVQNVQLALRILSSRNRVQIPGIGHLDLVALLDSGIPVQMPGRRELRVGSLKPESALVGKTIRDIYAEAKGRPLEIIGVVRDNQAILPTPTTLLRENDQLLIIGSREVREMLSGHMTPINAAKIRPLTDRPEPKNPDAPKT
jgi:CIC family chloride channel protein